MNIFGKLKSEKPSHPCLTCGKKIGKDYSEVRYKYKDGEGTAYICKSCAEEMDKPKTDEGDLDDFSI